MKTSNLRKKTENKPNKRDRRDEQDRLIQRVAGKVGLTKTDANNVLDAITSASTDSLARNDSVTFVGLDSFQVMEREAGRGVNPQIREVLDIPAENAVRFRPGKG